MEMEGRGGAIKGSLGERVRCAAAPLMFASPLQGVLSLARMDTPSSGFRHSYPVLVLVVLFATRAVLLQLAAAVWWEPR